MIDRYTRPQMGAIWGQQRKYDCWLEVELAVCHAMEQMGQVPHGVAKRVRKKVSVNPARIAAIEQVTKHDVIAFLESIAEQGRKRCAFPSCGSHVVRYFRHGLGFANGRGRTGLDG